LINIIIIVVVVITSVVIIRLLYTIGLVVWRRYRNDRFVSYTKQNAVTVLIIHSGPDELIFWRSWDHSQGHIRLFRWRHIDRRFAIGHLYLVSN